MKDAFGRIQAETDASNARYQQNITKAMKAFENAL